MSVPLRIHPEAESEFADAIRTYGKHAAELALDFEKAVDEGLLAIQQAPARYPVVWGETRRILIRRFPYGIFYIPRSHELRMLAIYHLRRSRGLAAAGLKQAPAWDRRYNPPGVSHLCPNPPSSAFPSSARS
jgi:plasmid stabilization system protein ParE